MTAKKFAEQSVKQDRFVTRVLSEPKVFVMGGEVELAKLVEDRITGGTRDEREAGAPNGRPQLVLLRTRHSRDRRVDLFYYKGSGDGAYIDFLSNNANWLHGERLKSCRLGISC